MELARMSDLWVTGSDEAPTTTPQIEIRLRFFGARSNSSNVIGQKRIKVEHDFERLLRDISDMINTTTMTTPLMVSCDFRR